MFLSHRLGTGPLFFAPLSEVYGRRIAILPAFFISACFAFSTAIAKDAQTIFISRFFCGFSGSAPIAVTAGSLSDIWPPKQRGKAMTVYAMAVITGPLLVPVVGSAFVTAKGLGWKWTEYVRSCQDTRTTKFLTRMTDYGHTHLLNSRCRYHFPRRNPCANTPPRQSTSNVSGPRQLGSPFGVGRDRLHIEGACHHIPATAIDADFPGTHLLSDVPLCKFCIWHDIHVSVYLRDTIDWILTDLVLQDIPCLPDCLSGRTLPPS